MESDWLQGPLWLKDEDWTFCTDQKLSFEHQQVENQIEISTISVAWTFLGALFSKPIDCERISQFNRLKFIIMPILKKLRKR